MENKFAQLNVGDLFEHVNKNIFSDRNSDEVYKNRKAEKSYAKFDLLNRLFDWQKANDIWQNNPKNFGSIAFYKRNPKWFLGTDYVSFEHLKRAHKLGVVSSNFAKERLLILMFDFHLNFLDSLKWR